jgi:hypothetical protein
VKLNKSVKSELRSGLWDLFDALEICTLMVENTLELAVSSFVEDFIKTVDEITEPGDIVKHWHISFDMAQNIFSILNDVMNSQLGDDVNLVCEEREALVELDMSDDSFDLSSSDGDM